MILRWHTLVHTHNAPSQVGAIEAAALAFDTLSIDAPVGHGSGERLLERIDLLPDAKQHDAAADHASQQELAEGLGETLDATLSAREAQVLRLRYGLGQRDGPMCSAADVARRLGISASRVQQLEANALRKLAASARVHELHELHQLARQSSAA